MTEDRLVSLIIRQQTGELAPEEATELEQWADQNKINRDFLERAAVELRLEKEINHWNKIDPAKGFALWQAHIQARRRARVWRLAGWSAAASMLVVVLLVAIISKNHSPAVQPVAVVAVSHPVMPGRNTAILTLANGQRVLLDSVGKGLLAMQGASRVVKADSGSLSYLGAGGHAFTLTYNVLTTPPSGQYQLKLPDGSKVWLNNVSSLRYPTSFPGKDRTVELTGEAYFEIAKDAARPFIVKVRDQAVEVLGTSFNVMAYPEEGGTQTTLLTGAVQVRTENAAVKLKPDEQTQVLAGGALNVAKDVPSEDIVSWKDGFFYVGRAASFEAMMRQLSRWYDVEVVYEGEVPDMKFGGKIDRTLPLNDLLKFLDKNQIHLRLEGRKLIVLPN